MLISENNARIELPNMLEAGKKIKDMLTAKRIKENLDSEKTMTMQSVNTMQSANIK